MCITHIFIIVKESVLHQSQRSTQTDKKLFAITEIAEYRIQLSADNLSTLCIEYMLDIHVNTFQQ